MARWRPTGKAAFVRGLLIGSLSLVMVVFSTIDVDGDPSTTNLPAVVATESIQVGCDERRRLGRSVPHVDLVSRWRRRVARAISRLTRSQILTLSILPIRGP
jgi:hypothetical protein